MVLYPCPGSKILIVRLIYGYMGNAEQFELSRDVHPTFIVGK